MNSQSDAAPDIIRSRGATDSSPLDHRTIASTSSSNRKQSLGNSETGESSRAASKRGSFTTGFTDGTAEGSPQGGVKLEASNPGKDGRGSHRSHRSRASGGFLLSKSTYEPPSVDGTKKTLDQDHHMRQRPIVRDRKGKNPARDVEKRHSKHQSKTGMRIQSSSLAGNVAAAPNPQVHSNDPAIDNEEDAGHGSEKAPPVAGLDVDSTQIVNLALNLNESRRNAARRNVSTPLPHLTPGFTEGFAGGSLRHHLQQQRRVSRNISPKPARGERPVTATPRVTSSQKLNTLQPAFEPHESYEYHFSASTLARAEKARNNIELMAHYRRLLQYVPPLKPQPERPGTGETGTTQGSPSTSAPNSRVTSSYMAPPHPLGRPYNPLQYVRNRKVRLRTGRAIDGEAQGFGELDRVSSWVDRVLEESSLPDYQGADCLFMPAFSKAAEQAASPNASPESQSKSHATAPKIKRPRNDWTTNPADMLADLYWMEQDDNKKMIEDSHGRKIFPQQAELRRPVSRRSNDLEDQSMSNNLFSRDDRGPDLMMDTKLPDFRSIKPEPERMSDSATSKAKEKLRQVRDAARIHHGHSNSIQEHLQVFRSHSRSHSRSDSTSESDSNHLVKSRRRRSGTMDSSDRGADILEKQMMAMLQREAPDGEWKFPSNPENRRHTGSSESQKPELGDRSESTGDAPASHSRSGSIVNNRKRDSALYSSSGRASLEVPGAPPRRSLEELDNTAPKSPETKAHRLSNAFIPSISMDVSPPRSRHTSPIRTPLSKVKSKINPFHDFSRDRSSNRPSIDESSALRLRAGATDPLPETPFQEKRQRSLSPIKKLTSRKTDEGVVKPSLKKTSSVRKTKLEEPSIKGLFKSRNPVTRVSDFIWKNAKEQLPGFASGFSTEESDLEDPGPPSAMAKKSNSRSSSVGLTDEDVAAFKSDKRTYSHELPSFTSPFEDRGRPIRPRNRDSKTSSDTQARKGAKATARASGLEPLPRIDVHNASPTSSPSPDSGDRLQRDSSVSDVDNRRASMASGAQLNEILGIPGKRRNALPTTGLSHLEVSENRRHWSISDQGVSLHRGPMTKCEITRVRALLLSSGIKAKEISRRAAELQDLRNAEDPHYAGIAALAHESIVLVPRKEQHILAARILSDDVQLSSQMWQNSADTFVSTTVTSLLSNIQTLQSRLADSLTPMTRQASDEADEVSKDLVIGQTLQVKRLTDKIDVMMRRRRRRFRWLRRAGWVMVEWALVGVMWYVWFMVVLARIVLGVGSAAVGVVRWLFWL